MQGTSEYQYRIGKANVFVADFGGIAVPWNAPIIDRDDFPDGYGVTGVVTPYSVNYDGTQYSFVATQSGGQYNNIWYFTTTNEGDNVTFPQSTPIVPANGSGWRADGVLFPVVFRDANASLTAERWKMFVGGYGADSTWRVGLFTAPDPPVFGNWTWTEYYANPVLNINDTPGAWNRYGIMPVDIVGSNLYVVGAPISSPFYWTSGLYTSSGDFTSWSEYGSNPIFSRDSTKEQTLTDNLTSGSTNVSVGDSSVFDVGEAVLIYDNGDATNKRFDLDRVKSLPSGTAIELEKGANRNYTVANTAKIKGLTSGSNLPPGVNLAGSRYMFPIFNMMFQEYSNYPLVEVTGLLTSTNETDWTVSNANSPLIPLGNDASPWYQSIQDLCPAKDVETTTTADLVTNAVTNLTVDENDVIGGIFSGNITSHGGSSSVNVSFEYGLTDAYGSGTTPVTVNATGQFTASIPNGLTLGQTYHVRAKGVNDTGISYGIDQTFTLTPPSVVTDNATSVGFYSALVSGNLTDRGTASSANVTFQWGTVSGNYTAETSGVSMNATGPFSANITGLSPATTYYFRARAQGHGSGYGSEKSFTTDSTPPSVSTDNATDIGYFSARLSGNVTSKGTADSVDTSFRWGVSSGNLTQSITVATTNNTGAYYSDLDGLSANTTYYFRTRATGHGIGDGEEKSFTTLPTTPPSVNTDNASNVTPYTARLNGELIDRGTASSANVSFRWGPTSGNYTGETTAQSVNSTSAFYYDLSGLSDNTTYYFRARADAGAHGDDSGEEVSFTTLVPVPPSLTTDNASNVSYFSALLSGNLTSRGTVSSANVSFQWGLTSGNLTSETSLVGMDQTGAFDTSLSNLSANTTYYFRSKAVGHGTTYGAEKSFTTLVTTAPAVITNDAVNVTYNSVRLSGNLTARGTSSSANVSFQRGTSSGNYTAETNVQSVSATGTFLADISSLSASTTYYFRSKAVGHGTAYGTEKTFTTSAAPSGGGGGGVTVPLTGLTGTAPQVDATGKTLNAVTLETPDKGGSVSIATGTKMVDKSGAAITSLTATVLTSPPAPPANGAVVAGYEMGPSGAQFTPPITLTLAFDSQKLAGVKTGDLYIAWWDGQQWQALESSVDPQTNTVSAQVSHFTQFALLGKQPAPTISPPSVSSVTPSPAPAKFVVSDLSIKPATSQPGEAVSITVKVANSGGTKGEYEIALSINGVIEDSKKLTLAAAASETIEFTVKKDAADTYRIDVNGLTGFFTVEKPAVATTSSAQALALAVEQPKSTPANRSLIIILLIAGLGVLGGAIFAVTRVRRQAR